MHINAIVKVRKLKNKKKEQNKKKFLIFIIESGETKKKVMLPKILDQL